MTEHKTQVLRLGNHRHPVDACPVCGGPKLKRAKHCRTCSPKMRVGEQRTNDPSRSTGWRRARALKPVGPCQYPDCEATGTDRHHVDGNPLNNDPANVAVYCRRHHMEVDGRLAALAARAQAAGRLGGRRKAVAT